MKILIVLTVLLQAAVTKAGLTCLEIAWWSPWVGLFCALAPDTFTTAEEAVLTEVNKTIAQAENAIDYAWKYNTITLTYNFIDTASRQGIAAANSQLGEEFRNISQVTIGFAKETVSQAMTVVQIASFGMIIDCMVANATSQAVISAYNSLTGDGNSSSAGQVLPTAASSSIASASTGGIAQVGNTTSIRQGASDSQSVTSGNVATSKRSVQDVASQAQAIGRQCIADHFAKPLYLQPSNDLQQQGADISDIASLLVPVVGEEEVAANLATDAVDLALPGLEDSTRILKLEEGATEGAHFASVDEANEVAANLEKEGWDSANCKVCTAPGFSKRQTIRGGKQLSARGAAFSMCCNVGEGATVGDTPTTEPSSENPTDSSSGGDTNSDGSVAFEGTDPNAILPEDVTVGPVGEDSFFPTYSEITSIPVRDPATGIADLINDLHTQQAATLGYSTAAEAIYDSDAVLSQIEDVVTSEDSTLRDILGFRKDTIYNRWGSEEGNAWLSSTDPRLADLQKWTNQVSQDLTSIGDKILAADTNNGKLLSGYKWTTKANLYYIEPGPQKKILGWHTDDPYLSFSTSNVDGLMFGLDGGSAVLAPKVDNGFYLILGTESKDALLHAVSSAAAVGSGRASIVFELSRVQDFNALVS